MPRSTQFLLNMLLATSIVVVGMYGYSLVHKSTPDAVPVAVTVDAKAKGREFAPILASDFGDGCWAVADLIKKGERDAGKLSAASKSTFQAARERDFDKLLAAEFIYFDPNRTPAAEAEANWRALGDGLKGR